MPDEALPEPSQPEEARQGTRARHRRRARVALTISRILREHDVTRLTDGREAVALIAAGAVCDVILSDLRMPRIAGIEVYESISWRCISMRRAADTSCASSASRSTGFRW